MKKKAKSHFAFFVLCYVRMTYAELPLESLVYGSVPDIFILALSRSIAKARQLLTCIISEQVPPPDPAPVILPAAFAR
jgi:hypothetical protein